jgi:hypothetical protein
MRYDILSFFFVEFLAKNWCFKLFDYAIIPHYVLMNGSEGVDGCY